MKLVGERRALAAAILAFYGLVYAVFALSRAAPELTPAFAGIAGVYGLAFFALVAGYFWARWFAVGVSLYGVILSVIAMWQAGTEPVLVFICTTHLTATLALWGGSMAEPYDGQTAWRERFHMDDNAVQRLGRSVIRAGVSLPLVLLYALAPRDGGASLAVGLIALGLTGFGLRALLQLKTWGVLALGAAGTLLVAVASADVIVNQGTSLQPALAGALLMMASVPFAAPMMRWLGGRL